MPVGRGCGWGRRVTDDGVGGGTSGRNDRRLEDKPVVCNGRECGYMLYGSGLNGRRRSRIGPRLLLLVGADCLRGAVDDSAEHFCVAGVRLALMASPNVAAPGNEGQRDDDGKDG